MRMVLGRLLAPVLALLMMSGLAAAQSKVTIAVGAGACLCYLPTVLAKQLGEYDKAGVSVELVDPRQKLGLISRLFARPGR